MAGITACDFRTVFRFFCIDDMYCFQIVYSWGRGEDGQLGLGDTNDQYRPVVVEALQDKGVLSIACGSGHTVVLTGNPTDIPFKRFSHIQIHVMYFILDDGDVYTWGRGDDGRLGHGDNGWKYVPRVVEALCGKNIRQVTCGSYHTAAVTGI